MTSCIPCAPSKAASTTRVGPLVGIFTEPPQVAMSAPPFGLHGRRDPSPGPVAYARREVRALSSPVAIPAAVCPLLVSIGGGLFHSVGAVGRV